MHIKILMTRLQTFDRLNNITNEAKKAHLGLVWSVVILHHAYLQIEVNLLCTPIWFCSS